MWQAVLDDFAAGGLGHRYLLDTEERNTNTYCNDFTMQWFYGGTGKPSSSSGMTITLTPAAARTIGALTELGVLDETHILLTPQAYQDYQLRHPVPEGGWEEDWEERYEYYGHDYGGVVPESVAVAVP